MRIDKITESFNTNRSSSNKLHGSARSTQASDRNSGKNGDYNNFLFLYSVCNRAYPFKQNTNIFQVVANPGQDHLALAVAQAIEEQFGGWVKPPSEREMLDQLALKICTCK